MLRQPKQRFVAGPKRLQPAFALPANFPPNHPRCRLRACGAELISFLRAIELLGPKLQIILIQLPPSLTPEDGKHALRKFLVQCHGISGLPLSFVTRAGIGRSLSG